MGCAHELHSRALNPHGGINRIHIKVILSTGDLILWVISIELRKVHLRKMAKGWWMGGGDGLWRVGYNQWWVRIGWPGRMRLELESQNR
jgi:hypothetical protein